MPKASSHFVTWIARGKRNHGSAYQDIGSQSNSTLAPGDTYQAQWAPPTLDWTTIGDDGKQVTHHGVFAFWSIAGGANGGVVDFNQLPQAVLVGSTEIIASANYIETGG